MEKSWFGLGGRRKHLKLVEAPRRLSPTKTFAGLDRFSDVVMAEVEANEDHLLSALRRYLKSVKKFWK
jgi:hypothetical protein